MPTRSPTGLRFVDQLERLPGWGTVNEAHRQVWPIENDLRKRLGRLDGTRQSFYILAMLPPDVDIDTMRPRDTAFNFLQCAGSKDRLTLEHIHPRDWDPTDPATWFDRDNPDNVADNVRDILGHDTPPAGEPTERIPMSGGDHQTVHPTEVFTLEQAVTAFAHYFRHGAPPPDLHPRTVTL